MPYEADHKESCKNQNRYIVTRQVDEVENRDGSILSNTDRGEIISRRCASCGAPAKWKNSVITITHR